MNGKIRVQQAVPFLTPELVLQAYADGLFPMAESYRDSRLYWIDPDWRAIFPFGGFHVPRRLVRTVRSGKFEVRVDTAFPEVVKACATLTPKRRDTWISERIVTLYTALHERGYAHSVECWHDERLAGGLYGVALGGGYFGESMFTQERDASKVALVHLYERLRAGGFVLFDIQFITPHLSQFGAIEIPRADYLARLREALKVDARFYSWEEDSARGGELQSITQTS